MTVPPEIPLWAYAAAGAFGGLAIELISILGAIQRCKGMPWRQEGEVPAGALWVSIVIRLVLGIGVALALGQSGEIAGLVAAIGAGAGAPLILEQLAKQVVGQVGGGGAEASSAAMAETSPSPRQVEVAAPASPESAGKGPTAELDLGRMVSAAAVAYQLSAFEQVELMISARRLSERTSPVLIDDVSKIAESLRWRRGKLVFEEGVEEFGGNGGLGGYYIREAPVTDVDDIDKPRGRPAGGAVFQPQGPKAPPVQQADTIDNDEDEDEPLLPVEGGESSGVVTADPADQVDLDDLQPDFNAPGIGFQVRSAKVSHRPKVARVLLAAIARSTAAFGGSSTMDK